MAAELEDLYEEIRHKYDVHLCTKSCFGKKIDWIHSVDSVDSASFLHGNELVFNSGSNSVSKEWMKNFIDAIYQANASGIVMGLRENDSLPEDIVEYCNELAFPLFSTAWSTPFIDIMRIFSEILLKNEQNETNLAAALKNAVSYPENVGMYKNQLEHNGFYEGMFYNVIIIGSTSTDIQSVAEEMQTVEKAIQFNLRHTISYVEQGTIVILIPGYTKNHLCKSAERLQKKFPNLHVGIGSEVHELEKIYVSYKNAMTAYRLCGASKKKTTVLYDEIGVYKVLAEAGDDICEDYAEEVLGKLTAYDREHNTDYTKILEAFMECECSILNTSKMLYCHKNTLAYKMNKIREILGYDVMQNENRMRIMIAFRIKKLSISN